MDKKLIMAEIRHARKEYKDAIRNLGKWFDDPEGYIRNGCDSGREWEISYASTQLGEIAALEKILAKI